MKFIDMSEQLRADPHTGLSLAERYCANRGDSRRPSTGEDFLVAGTELAGND